MEDDMKMFGAKDTEAFSNKNECTDTSSTMQPPTEGNENSFDHRSKFKAVDISNGMNSVIKTMLHEGTGNCPEDGDLVSVHYTGKFSDGKEFDSSVKRGTPLNFTLGEGKVIKGFYMGIKSMKVGEKSSFKIAPDYAYGPGGDGNLIPPNSTLFFEVELLSCETPGKNSHQMSLEEKVQISYEKKEKGNAMFKEGRISIAVNLYKEALEYFTGVEFWPNAIKDKKESIELGCHLNLSNCYIKTQEFGKSIYHGTEALKISPNNVKGLYRRGVAGMKYGNLKTAFSDLNNAHKLDPKNNDILKDLHACKKAYSKYNEAEKMKYKNWMKTLDLYGDKSGPIVPTIADRVYFNISIESLGERKLVFGLYKETPKTSANFKALCTGEKGIGKSGLPLHFKSSKFHRLIKNFMIQGGDFTAGNGTGGESIYGEKFPDENFTHKHTKRGLLSMANSGPNTNGSQFFLTFVATPHLDGRHVVFGELVEGFDVLDELEEIPTDQSDVPQKSIEIMGCGVVED